MSEKTEQPTAKKLRDARNQGQIAKSRLMTATVVTLGAATGLYVVAEALAARWLGWARGLLMAHQSPAEALEQAGALFVASAAPCLSGALLASLGAAVAQAGWQVNFELVAPKLDRIDAFAGIKKLISMRQVFELGKGLLCAGLVFALAWSTLRTSLNDMLGAIRLGGIASFQVMAAHALPFLFRAIALLAGLGALDYLLARRRHVNELMMTKQEVKQEHKNSEGDPHQKAKRKQLQRQLAAGGGARGLKSATAVVVNPTHIAIALRYAESECEAPYIVAKGREEDALKLKQEAKDLKIPVVKDIPLARSLIHYDVGEEIPEELYQAAAAVLKVALESKERKS